MDTQTALLVGLVISMLIPILNGLITRFGAVEARVYLQLFLNAANGFLTEWMIGGPEYDVGRALLLSGSSLVIAIATQAGVWKPLHVSDMVKNTGGFIGTAVPPERRMAA